MQGDGREGEILTIQIIGYSIAAIGAAVLIGLLLYLIHTVRAKDRELAQRPVIREKNAWWDSGKYGDYGDD